MSEMLDREVWELAKRFADLFKIDRYIVFGMIMTESAGNEKADSGYARGLMQVSKIALEDIKHETLINYDYDDLFKPEVGVLCGVAYLNKLLKYWVKYFDGEYYLAMSFAILSYAWGIGHVRKWLEGTADNKYIDESVPPEKKYYNESVMFWGNYARRFLNAQNKN
jgi:soluble lytic murein transglycosylase